MGSQLARHDHGSAGRQGAFACSTLTVKWWASTPEPLRLGPAEYLLRALSGSATNLDLFWQSVVERMKRYEFYFLDPRLVSIEFGGGGKTVRRRFATIDTFAFRIYQRSIGYAALVIKSRAFQAGLTNFLSKSDKIALLHEPIASGCWNFGIL
jgi:hypothetical protein